MKNSNIFLQIAGVGMILIALGEIFSAITLYNTGQSVVAEKEIVGSINQILTAVAGLIIISILFIVGGAAVIAGKTSFINISMVFILLYVIIALLNGYLLYNEPIEIGFAISMSVAIGLLLFLYLGKRGVVNQIKPNN